ncbi:hypothetical protein ACHAXS_003461 [Conticribra weissflogii]
MMQDRSNAPLTRI